MRRQEREIVFRTITDADGWNPEVEKVVKVRGLASAGSNGLSPDATTAVQSGSIRLFLSKAHRRAVDAVEVGSEVEVDGVTYAVSKMDKRGVLPGAYPLRFEGVKK